MQIFGFEIRKSDELPSIAQPNNNDGSIEQIVGTGAAHYAYAFDINKKLSNEIELINKYRSLAQIAEIDSAIDEIVTEAVVVEEEKLPISLNVIANDDELPPQIKAAIIEEFKNILALMEFNTDGHDLFRQWYVDGRLYGQLIVDETNLSEGVKEIRFIDPRKIKKVREIQKERNSAGVDIVTGTEEYFVFNDSGINAANAGIKISPDVILYAPSGYVDETGNTISPLHKSIKPANQLRYMEDAVLIYTLSRAPERRVFYIDVADMPKQKAEQYVKDVMNRYRNKIVYDQSTGEVKDDRVHMSIQEDFWLPRRCFSLDTKVKLLDGRDASIEQLMNEHNSGKVNWTYSVSDDGQVVPGKITWAGITMRDAKVVDVHLDNGEVITCTPDHKFILSSGEKVQAQFLTDGASLMSLYTEKGVVSEADYEYVLDNKTKTLVPTHRMVSEYINGETKVDESIIHIDGNRFNNSPENLRISYSLNEEIAPIDVDSVLETKVTKVAFREDRIDVGTLTVDGDENYHAYHNYSLSAGVFVMNSNGRTTEITTLPGSSIMTQMDNVNYFLNKLYASLNLPMSRVKPDANFSLGRSTEISRDEVKFGKFVARLRRKFSEIFYQALRAQLILKGIIAPEDWQFIKSKINFDFLRDNYFSELKENEILTGRLQMAEMITPYVGMYYSHEYLRNVILRQSSEEIENIDKQLAIEMKEHPEWFAPPPGQPQEGEA
jgi:intein/homing endonuclease